MNIFYVNRNPIWAARELPDKHTVKMPLETAQMLCTAISVNNPNIPTRYKPTHHKHPCTRWVSKSQWHFRWLCEHGLELCAEYTRRYGKIHKCEEVIRECQLHIPFFPDNGFTDPPLCVSETIKDGYPNVEDFTILYQFYIKYEKAHLKWTKGEKPSWAY